MSNTACSFNYHWIVAFLIVVARSRSVLYFKCSIEESFWVAAKCSNFNTMRFYKWPVVRLKQRFADWRILRIWNVNIGSWSRNLRLLLFFEAMSWITWPKRNMHCFFLENFSFYIIFLFLQVVFSWSWIKHCLWLWIRSIHLVDPLVSSEGFAHKHLGLLGNLP